MKNRHVAPREYLLLLRRIGNGPPDGLLEATSIIDLSGCPRDMDRRIQHASMKLARLLDSSLHGANIVNLSSLANPFGLGGQSTDSGGATRRGRAAL